MKTVRFGKFFQNKFCHVFVFVFVFLGCQESEHMLNRGTQHPLSFALEILKVRKEGIVPATGLEYSA